jgi:hypothetical protein
MGEYKTLSKQIESAIEEAHRYINHAPHFDNQTINILSGAYKAGWLMLQETGIEKYSWLRNMTNQMRTWTQNADPFIKQTRKKHDAFLIGKKQVEDQFRKTKSEIKLQRSSIERKWGWYRTEALPFIDLAEQSLDVEVNEWKRLEERNWAELTIHKAIARCEQLIKFAEETLNNFNQQLGKVKQKQSNLDGKVSDINNLSFNNLGKLSQEEQQEIRKLISLAKSAQHYDTVEEYLEYAASLAMKRANRQVRKEIKKIIHIHSDGAPVFMDRVDNRYGSISGRKNYYDDEDE